MENDVGTSERNRSIITPNETQKSKWKTFGLIILLIVVAIVVAVILIISNGLSVVNKNLQMPGQAPSPSKDDLPMQERSSQFISLDFNAVGQITDFDPVTMMLVVRITSMTSETKEAPSFFNYINKPVGIRISADLGSADIFTKGKKVQIKGIIKTTDASISRGMLNSGEFIASEVIVN